MLHCHVGCPTFPKETHARHDSMMDPELHEVPRLFYEPPYALLIVSSYSLVAWAHLPPGPE